jgi:hypothetical protein
MSMDETLGHVREGIAKETELLVQLTAAVKSAQAASRNTIAYAQAADTAIEFMHQASAFAKRDPVRSTQLLRNAQDVLAEVTARRSSMIESGDEAVFALTAGEIGAVALAADASRAFNAGLDFESTAGEVAVRASRQEEAIQATGEKAAHATDIVRDLETGNPTEAAALFDAVAEESLRHGTVAQGIREAAEVYVNYWQG